MKRFWGLIQAWFRLKRLFAKSLAALGSSIITITRMASRESLGIFIPTSAIDAGNSSQFEGRFSMTPQNRIKREILTRALLADSDLRSEMPDIIDLHTDEGVYSAYGAFVELYAHFDFENDFREGEIGTGIECDFSRHYESKSVAMQMQDGGWVGWTYWFGGGKHGTPEEIEWIEYAYELSCIEQEKMVTVRTFEKTICE